MEASCVARRYLTMLEDAEEVRILFGKRVIFVFYAMISSQSGSFDRQRATIASSTTAEKHELLPPRGTIRCKTLDVHLPYMDPPTQPYG